MNVCVCMNARMVACIHTWPHTCTKASGLTLRLIVHVSKSEQDVLCSYFIVLQYCRKDAFSLCYTCPYVFILFRWCVLIRNEKHAFCKN